jgi:circadian clock protein KaiC
MRLAQEAREEAATLNRQQEIDRRHREMDHKRDALEAQIATQRAQFEAEADELRRLIAQEQGVTDRLREGREEMGRSRRADEPSDTPKARSRKLAPRGDRK